MPLERALHLGCRSQGAPHVAGRAPGARGWARRQAVGGCTTAAAAGTVGSGVAVAAAAPVRRTAGKEPGRAVGAVGVAGAAGVGGVGRLLLGAGHAWGPHLGWWDPRGCSSQVQAGGGLKGALRKAVGLWIGAVGGSRGTEAVGRRREGPGLPLSRVAVGWASSPWKNGGPRHGRRMQGRVPRGPRGGRWRAGRTGGRVVGAGVRHGGGVAGAGPGGDTAGAVERDRGLVEGVAAGRGAGGRRRRAGQLERLAGGPGSQVGRNGGMPGAGQQPRAARHSQ